MSQHLGENSKSNALRRNLVKCGVNVEACPSFKLIAYGPILPEQSSMEQHRPSLDIMAGLEKGLCDALKSAGYDIVNKVKCRKPIDKAFLRQILAKFESEFQKLKGAK